MSGDSVDLGYSPSSTWTRETLLKARDREAQRVRSCGPCRRGAHDACVLIGCRCVVTAACRRNERLTVDREGPLP